MIGKERVEFCLHCDNLHLYRTRINSVFAEDETVEDFPSGIFLWFIVQSLYAVAQRLRHCATNRKVAGSISDGVTGFFMGIILSVALWPWSRLSL
jgi:hypothetical protein